VTAPIDWGDEPEPAKHCGRADAGPLHSRHRFIRGRDVSWCPGGASERSDSYGARVNAPLRPETVAALNARLETGDAPRRSVSRTAEQPARHTVDTITSDALDQLYAERDMLGREADRLRKDWVTMRARAKQAEAAIAHALDAATCWEQMPSDRYVYIHEAARAFRAVLDEPKEPLPDSGGPIYPNAKHQGGNAEDCQACCGSNTPYPFICPGP
jgi:hypothetical protein